MKTLDDALKTPGVIRYQNYNEAIDQEVFIDGDHEDVRIDGTFTSDQLRRIADHLDPQPVAARVIPEGWRLVPDHLTAEMENAAGDSSDNRGYWPDIFAAILASAPPAPLRTEAEVRAEARREALIAAAAAVVERLYPRNPRHDWTDHAVDMAAASDNAADAILALIDREPSNG